MEACVVFFERSRADSTLLMGSFFVRAPPLLMTQGTANVEDGGCWLLDVRGAECYA